MSKYNGQPTFGKFKDWFIDDEGVVRNLWTNESQSEMGARIEQGVKVLEDHGLGKSQEAGMLRKSLVTFK